MPTNFDASKRASFPRQSIVSEVYVLVERIVAESITILTPFRAWGNVDGIERSPYINSAPQSFKKALLRKSLTKHLTW